MSTGADGGCFPLLPGPVAAAVRVAPAGGITGGAGGGWNSAEAIAVGIGAGAGGAASAAGDLPAPADAAGIRSRGGGGGGGWLCCGSGSEEICGDCKLDSIGPGSGGSPVLRGPFAAAAGVALAT